MNCFSGKRNKWIHDDVIYKVSNNITSAVYAFGLFDKEPDEHLWPFFAKEVYYIGMSGGQIEPYTVDKKSEKTYRMQTAPHLRMKDHKSKPDGKIKHPWVQEQIACGKQLYVSFIFPPENIAPELIRNWLSTVESEQILVYQQIFGKTPLLNLAERSDVDNTDPDSFSQQTLKLIKENSLDRFFL